MERRGYKYFVPTGLQTFHSFVTQENRLTGFSYADLFFSIFFGFSFATA